MTWDPLCRCGHRLTLHNGDHDDDRCYKCDCWQYHPGGDDMRSATPDMAIAKVGSTVAHKQVEECPYKGPHLKEDCTLGTHHRPAQTKSSNPKDVLAREEQRVLLHLLPSPGLVHASLAMMDGARKYGPYNWRDEGVGAGTYVSAAMRHIRDWLDGEEVAPDSGTHHLGHAVACLLILMDAQAVGNLVDDRPPYAPTSEMMEDVKETGRVSTEEDLKLDEAIAEMPDYEPDSSSPCQREDQLDAQRYFCIFCSWKGEISYWIEPQCPQCGAYFHPGNRRDKAHTYGDHI